MSRSIGDFIAASVGVSCDPEIFEYILTKESKYTVTASDGIWEFLTNEDVLRIVNPFYEKGDIEGACNKLIEEATLQWEEEDVVVDDITVVVIFFDNMGN